MTISVKMSLMDFIIENDPKEFPRLSGMLVDLRHRLGRVKGFSVSDLIDLFKIAEYILNRSELRESESEWIESNEKYFHEKASIITRISFPDGAEEEDIKEYLYSFYNGKFSYRTVHHFLEAIILYADRHSEKETKDLLNTLGGSMNIIVTTFSDIRYSYLDEKYDRKMKELFNTHIMTM